MRMLKRHSRQDVTTSETYANKDYHPQTERTKNVTKPPSVQTRWRHSVQGHNYSEQNSVIKRDRFVNISQNEKNVPLNQTGLRALFVWGGKKGQMIYYRCLNESSVNFETLKDNLSGRSSPWAHLTWTALKPSIRPKWGPKFWEIYGQANKKWKRNPEKKEPPIHNTRVC